MKQAFFYLLTEDEPSFTACQKAFELDKQILLTQREKLACWLACRYFQTHKKVMLFCEDKLHAKRMDEALWAWDPKRFIAHNLALESLEQTVLQAPIEIAWPGHRSVDARDILIYLATDFSDVTTFFKSVIDFVPSDDNEKEQARQRYKQFRDMGFHLKTSNVPEKFLLDNQKRT